MKTLRSAALDDVHESRLRHGGNNSKRCPLLELGCRLPQVLGSQRREPV
jgi:hypothetical protein